MVTLICDDNEVWVRGIEKLIPGEKLKAYTFADAQRLAAVFNPNVVVLDVQLPDAYAIYDWKGLADPGREVVIVTAYSNGHDGKVVTNDGAYAYLNKDDKRLPKSVTSAFRSSLVKRVALATRARPRPHLDGKLSADGALSSVD